MSLLIKICGLKSAEALEAALDAGADLVGFVFFPPSPRHLALTDARALGAQVNERAAKVALTVDADDATLDAIVDALAPDMLQLHGHETVARVVAVKQRYDLPVMKAIPVERAADVAEAARYAEAADRLLFDARAPREATRPGGLGTPFDWSLLENLTADIPFMLSGGLSPRNVADALAITQAQGVDVSSGVERAPGEKDPELIRQFIRAARTAADARASGARNKVAR